jgi:protein arginine N-methyltransferase 1
MIADRVRIDSYHEAIQRCVKPGDIVVDLGTGTGILSMFAAQRKPAQVYAIEHGMIIETAKEMARLNGTDCINFVKSHSKNFATNEKVDVILHEQMGEKLFDENMIDNICDLRDRLLRPGGKILPSCFDLFIEPLSLKDEYRIPLLHQHDDVHGISYARLGSSRKRIDGDSIKIEKSLQRLIKRCEADRFLCIPEGIYSIDLATVNRADVPKRIVYRKTFASDGLMDGLCMYFRVRFDDTLAFDTSPFSANTSWNPVLIRLETQAVRAGDVIECDWDVLDIADIGTWTLRYRIFPGGTAAQAPFSSSAVSVSSAGRGH